MILFMYRMNEMLSEMEWNRIESKVSKLLCLVSSPRVAHAVVRSGDGLKKKNECVKP